MHLNHANLPVADVAGLRAFFVDHFDFAVLDSRGPDAFAVLRGEDGFILNLMRAGAGDRGFPSGFHVGFLVAGRAAVEAKHAELVAAGHDAGAVADLTRGDWASTTFYCRAPGGVLVEVSAPLAASEPGSSGAKPGRPAFGR